MSKDLPWRRVAAEGVVIVASILMAFGIDAWWAERGQRAAERNELDNIREELVGDRGRLEQNVRAQARRAESAATVIALIEGLPGETGMLQVPDSMVALLVQAPTFEARTPTLRGLLQSGSVSVIRDSSVRSALAEWERLLANVSERELDARALVDEAVVPALIERGNVGRVLRGARLNARGASWKEAGLEGSTTLRVDTELSGLVSQRYATAEHASHTLSQALRALDTLVAAIEMSLGT
jgi:hypothetical protein